MTPPQENTVAAPQQDMAVLDQVKKQRGKAERMTTEQILAKSLEGTGQDPIQFQDMLANIINNDPKFRIMRSGNTLFFYENMGQGNVEIGMLTTDKPTDLVDAVKDVIAAAKAAGGKTGTFDIERPEILRVLQQAGVKYQIMPGQGMMPDGKTPAQKAMVEF